LAAHLPSSKTRRVDAGEDLGLGRSDRIPALVWGRRNPGLGLLRALQSGQPIRFDDAADCPSKAVPTVSGHLVVCEDGDDLAQVIAANYAYAIGAGMCLIPEVPKEAA
jgi:hypothetical protein